MSLPEKNDRVRQLIDKLAKGNTSLFVNLINEKIDNDKSLSQQQVNRLFHPEKRNGKFPNVSGNIIDAILKAFQQVNPTWLLAGQEPMLIEENPSANKNNIPPASSVGLSPTLESLLTNLMQQQNALMEKQNRILELHNATVLDKLEGLQKAAAMKTDVIELKKDITRQLGDISSQMSDGVSSVLLDLKSLKSAGQKELVPSGKSKKH